MVSTLSVVTITVIVWSSCTYIPPGPTRATTSTSAARSTMRTRAAASRCSSERTWVWVGVRWVSRDDPEMCIPPPRYRAAPRRLPSLLDMSLPHSLAELSCVCGAPGCARVAPGMVAWWATHKLLLVTRFKISLVCINIVTYITFRCGITLKYIW